MNCEIIAVGDEVLTGDILNTNAQYIAACLEDAGARVLRQTVVGDDPAQIRQALAAALNRCDIVITTGGLGPTYDDITKEAAAELMGRLAEEKPTHSRARSQLVFALLCELADADSAAPALPPLVQAAIEDIRANYAGLYGVEELSERLGGSKSHLVRTFTASVGVPPGKYLTPVRIEAAQRLLLHREYTLDVVASLCGFSGANYLCRVFKKETGQSPAQWRALTGRAAQSGLTPEETMREQEMYI